MVNNFKSRTPAERSKLADEVRMRVDQATPEQKAAVDARRSSTSRASFRTGAAATTSNPGGRVARVPLVRRLELSEHEHRPAPPPSADRADHNIALLTLAEWGLLRYGDKCPHLNTLRRWANKGNIYPKPRKHGRAFMVRVDAVYVDPMNPNTLAEALVEMRGSSVLP